MNTTKIGISSEKHGYEVRVFTLGYDNSREKVLNYLRNQFTDQTHKIIVMEDFIPRDVLKKVHKSKLVLFMWEPIGKTEDEDYYSRIYTFNDDLVGTKNYYKFCYPALIPSHTNLIPFENRKLCTAVVSHWLPERIEYVKFFMDHHPDMFDLYGNYHEFIKNNAIYKGRIPGFHSGDHKINVLKNYNFFFAFENSSCPKYHSDRYFAPGYITEKMFNAFAAGCVPIYYGPSNIEMYVPKECFINYQDFSSLEELYETISNMSEDVYQKYVHNIQNYLNSDTAKKWFSQTAFEEKILEAAIW